MSLTPSSSGCLLQCLVSLISSSPISHSGHFTPFYAPLNLGLPFLLSKDFTSFFKGKDNPLVRSLSFIVSKPPTFSTAILLSFTSTCPAYHSFPSLHIPCAAMYLLSCFSCLFLSTNSQLSVVNHVQVSYLNIFKPISSLSYSFLFFSSSQPNFLETTALESFVLPLKVLHAHF